MVLIPGRKVVLSLAGVACFLLLAFIACQLVRFETGHGSLLGIVQAFDLNGEDNIPSFFSTLLLLIAAVLLRIIATFKKVEKAAYASHWAVLSYIFFFLAFDEAASMHELLIPIMRRFFHVDGIFYFGWVIVGGPLVLAFAVSYLRFLLDLPMKWRIPIAISGIMYVSGALGMEMLGGRYLSKSGSEDFNYQLHVMAEEGLEMFGVILFIAALFGYIRVHKPNTEISFH